MSELLDLLRSLPGPDTIVAGAIAARALQVLRPTGAFRRLDEVATWLAAWQRTDPPSVRRPALAVFVADHGVAVEGVSAYPAEVTKEMLRALNDGMATANVMARSLGVTVEVVDVGVGDPTGNITIEDAMTPERFAAAVEAGRDAVARLDCDLFIAGEMGIGNTTAAATVAAALLGGPVEDWVGAGTGVAGGALGRKRAAVRQARERLHGASPIEVLRAGGGAELAAIAGAIVEARARSIPVVLDGYVVTAAAAVLEATTAGALDHCIAGHRSPEPGHGRLLDWLGKAPLLDLELRLGEGSGALAALPLITLAAAAVCDVPTFAEWGTRLPGS